MSDAAREAALKIMERYHLTMYEMDIQDNTRIIAAAIDAATRDANLHADCIATINQLSISIRDSEARVEKAERERDELRGVLSNVRDSLVWYIAQTNRTDSALLSKTFAEHPKSRPRIIEVIDNTLERFGRQP